jgi:hypothetical protein
MKTVLFVPGFQEDISSRDYVKTIKAIEQSGYKVKFVDIHWLRTTIDNWVEEFNAVYDAYDPKDTILAGFSYGAMTVFMSAANRNPAELWLFSLSPYFIEDIENDSFNQSWLKSIGHRRVDAFKKLSFSKLIKRITSKILFFYGDLELKKWPDISYREDVIRKLPMMKIRIAIGAQHDVTSDAYIDAIKEEIRI